MRHAGFFPLFPSLAIAAVALPAAALAHTFAETRKIQFPDVPGHRTLKCDLHQHTVFSDGLVWPSIRVNEAVRDGIDAIAITDHLEYQPHLSDIPHPDRNRSVALARDAAAATDLLVLRGAEVTRDMPPGHINAIFLHDVNALLRDDALEALREAARQDAFLFWNHPSWTDQTPDGVARLTPLHEQLLREKLIHGIEVVNDGTFSDEALQFALDHNLTILGNSDIHGLIDWEYGVAEGGHRPLTLVFATEKSEIGIKDALRERRTLVWFRNTLIGRPEWIEPLLLASLRVRGSYRPGTTVLDLMVTNVSDAEFLLRNASPYRLHEHAGTIAIPPHGAVKIAIKTVQRIPRATVAFEVLNTVTAPGAHATVAFAVDLAEK